MPNLRLLALTMLALACLVPLASADVQDTVNTVFNGTVNPVLQTVHDNVTAKIGAECSPGNTACKVLEIICNAATFDADGDYSPDQGERPIPGPGFEGGQFYLLGTWFVCFV